MKVYTIQRICIYILFVAALSSACHKHEMEEPVEGLRKICIEAETGPDTKASLSSDDGTFSWEYGDRLSVLATDGRFYTFTYSDDDDLVGGNAVNETLEDEVLWTDIEQGKTPGRTRVTFVGHIPQEADITDVAFYPAVFENGTVNEIWSEGKLAYSLPSEYDHVSGTVNVPMVAFFEKNSQLLSFRQVGAVLRFSVKNLQPSVKVVLTFPNNRVTGSFAVDSSQGETCISSLEGSSVVTVRCQNGSPLEVLSVPVPAGVINTFRIEVFNVQNKRICVKEFNGRYRIPRAALVMAGELDLPSVNYELSSPSGLVVSNISLDGNLSYDMFYDGIRVMDATYPSMTLADEVWGTECKVVSIRQAEVDNVVKAEFYQKSTVEDRYNSVLIDCGESYDVEFRAYDDGLAYRFISKRDGGYVVSSENAEFNFAGDFPVHAAASPMTRNYDLWQSSFEGYYAQSTISGLMSGKLYQSPMMVQNGGTKFVVAESDVLDYPGMFLERSSDEEGMITGRFAPVASSIVPRTNEPYTMYDVTYGTDIAHCEGPRSFPWRVVCASSTDAQLYLNDMIWRLATPSKVQTTSWIKPGLAVWDYWSNWNGKGGSGTTMTMDDYKTFIDLASSYGIEYYVIDGGWTDGVNTKIRPRSDIDLKSLAEYAEGKGVGLLLWCGATHFNYFPEDACQKYSEMGIKGFKIDYWEHDNQDFMNMMEDAAAIAARYNLVLDMHGCTKPSGLNRTYPNIVTFEGVRGLEYSVINPSTYYEHVNNNLIFPFVRQISGPVDLTPGAMTNVSLGNAGDNAQDSEGTRAHQMALFITTWSPLGCLCDSPARYTSSEDNRTCISFLGKLPASWDETIVLDAQMGSHLMIARRSGDNWYVGGINGSSKRNVTLSLGNFLTGGEWQMEMIRDNTLSAYWPARFDHSVGTVTSGSSVDVTMQAGGGFAAVFTKQ